MYLHIKTRDTFKLTGQKREAIFIPLARLPHEDSERCVQHQRGKGRMYFPVIDRYSCSEHVAQNKYIEIYLTDANKLKWERKYCAQQKKTRR